MEIGYGYLLAANSPVTLRHFSACLLIEAAPFFDFM
jgi:hypothetical protein